MSAVCYFKRNAIHWYFSDKNEGLTAQISQGAISNLEIVDEMILMQEVGKAVGKVIPKPPVQTMLILDDDICFSTKVPQPVVPENLKNIASDVPFSHVETVTVHYKTDDLAVSANSDLYQAIVRSLGQVGYDVTLIIPWVAVIASGISENGEMDRVTVKRIFDATATLKGSSFSFEKSHPSDLTLTQSNKASQPKKLPIGWIIFISIALVYAAVMLWVYIRG